MTHAPDPTHRRIGRRAHPGIGPLAGPSGGGLILRDMGAEVIKLESDKSSDLRDSSPFVGDMSVQFDAYNRGKKSVTHRVAA